MTTMLFNHSIFPYTKENIDTIIQYYFFKNGMSFVPGNLQFIYNNDSKLKLSELEYISMIISDHLDFFKSRLSINSLTISNLLHYGVDAYKLNFNKGSKSRNIITKECYEMLFKIKS
jgi:hypothetical protein